MLRTLYHYCPGDNVPKILTHGQLRPSAAGARPGERPALWFTSRPTYEPTAIKLWVQGGFVRSLTLQEMAEAYGLARFVVPEEVAPLTWVDWARTSGVRAVEVKRMARASKRLGSDVKLYRAAYEPVPVELCLAIEESTDGRTWSTMSTVALAA